MPMRPTIERKAAAAATLALLALACGRETPIAGGPGGRVENPALGIALAAVPQPFEVEANQGETLRLTAPGPNGPGVLEFAVGPVETAVNLVEAVKARKAEFEARPEGEYLGNRELVTPFGTAFTARGTYTAGGATVEETWIYAVHPSAERKLTLTYTYPTGESKERVDQLLAILGEVEGLGAPGGAESAEPPPAAAPGGEQPPGGEPGPSAPDKAG